MGRYGLKNLHSLMELAEIVGLCKWQVEAILVEKGIIEKRTLKNRWSLTEAGWEYGIMYNPTIEQFFTGGDAMCRGNYQPVFNDDVIDLF